MSHNLNPFDFVPFSEKEPVLKTPNEWLKNAGEPLTGYIELKIKALQPIHIVGEQSAVGIESDEWRIEKSSFNRQNGHPCIPSSSIRGLLRSFLETLCNGWASEFTSCYPKKRKEHFSGFKVIEKSEEIKKATQRNEIDNSIPVSLDEKFVPKIYDDERMDVCSFLFGTVLEEREKKEKNDVKSNSRKTCLIIEDAIINSEDLNSSNYQLPDVADKAFMGGAHPSASSWWYQKPYQIRTKDFGMPHFIGSGFRGRKFYFHQNPRQCIGYYKDPDKWKTRRGHPIYKYAVETLPLQKTTKPFRIYFENVPSELLNLFLISLFPGERMKHKIGYGKAYGFGSMLFEFESCSLRKKSTTYVEKLTEIVHLLKKSKWENDFLYRLNVTNLIDFDGLKELYKILYYDEDCDLVFTYPPFSNGWFLPKNPKTFRNDFYEMIEKVLSQDQIKEFRRTKKLSIVNEAKKLATELFNNGIRRATHFEVYKENADGYDIIQNRKLN